MKGKITVNDHAREGGITIDIEGVIGIPEQMQFEEAGSRISTYSSLRDLLERVSGHAPGAVTVNIRSTGGSVADALLIYDFLKSCGAEVTTRCFGYAASAATIIAQAASPGKREISAICLYLIHNSSCETEGNRLEMETALDMLRRTDERIAAIYSLNSGRPADSFTSLMGENAGRGKWLPAEDVIGYGLADVVIGGSPLGRKDRRMVKNLGLPPLPGSYILVEAFRTAADKIRQFFADPGPQEKIEEAVIPAAGPQETINSVQDENGKSAAEIKKPARVKKGKPADKATEVKKPEGIPAKPAEASATISAEELARKAILPSVTKQKEDPSVYGQKLTHNQEAYMEDLRKIKTV